MHVVQTHTRKKLVKIGCQGALHDQPQLQLYTTGCKAARIFFIEKHQPVFFQKTIDMASNNAMLGIYVKLQGVVRIINTHRIHDHGIFTYIYH